jgi:hypothetical protein
VGSIERVVSQGEMKFFETQRRSEPKEESSVFGFIPDFVSVEFDMTFRSAITAIFHHLGLDFVSKYTKISLFCLLVLNPICLVIALILYNTVLDFFDPAPKLIPINP